MPPPIRLDVARKVDSTNRPPAKKLRTVASSTNANAPKTGLQTTRISHPGVSNRTKANGSKLQQQSIVVALTGGDATAFVWDDLAFGE